MCPVSVIELLHAWLDSNITDSVSGGSISLIMRCNTINVKFDFPLVLEASGQLTVVPRVHHLGSNVKWQAVFGTDNLHT